MRARTCEKYISLPLYACVGLWSNETPTSRARSLYFDVCPSFAHIRRKLQMRPFPIDPPSANLISRTHPLEPVRSTFSLPFDAVRTVDNEMLTKPSAALYNWRMPLLRTHPSQTSNASFSDRPPFPRILSLALTLVRSTFSLPFDAVRTVDNETPTKPSAALYNWRMPLLRTHPSQTSIASISDRPPFPRILSLALTL